MNPTFDSILIGMVIQQVGLINMAQTAKPLDPDEITELANGLYAILSVVEQMTDSGLSEITKETLDIYIAKIGLIAGSQSNG